MTRTSRGMGCCYAMERLWCTFANSLCLYIQVSWQSMEPLPPAKYVSSRTVSSLAQKERKAG